MICSLFRPVKASAKLLALPARDRQRTRRGSPAVCCGHPQLGEQGHADAARLGLDEDRVTGEYQPGDESDDADDLFADGAKIARGCRLTAGR